MRTIDIETNMAHDHIWCVVEEDHNSGGIYCYADDYSLLTADQRDALVADGVTLLYRKDFVVHQDTYVGHNAIGFDFPVLGKRWGKWFQPEQMMDTVILSRMYDCNVSGGHSLKAWGERLNKDDGKLDYTEHDEPVTYDKIVYCVQDVRLTTKLYHHLTKRMDDMKFDTHCRMMEMRVAYYMQRQEDNGFYFDIDRARRLYASLTIKLEAIEEELREAFPPITHVRYSEKTGNRLKDRIEVFNPGSRMQIAKRLEGCGVKWTKFTENGNIIVDENTLGDYRDKIHEAGLVYDYLRIQKKASMVKGWLKHYNPETHRIHGHVNTNGAVTRRMTHTYPNVAQVDSDKDTRSCWTVPEGCVLVGTDAAGLELRMLAHYMDDEEYTDLILNGDIHTYNQEAAGLETRDQAKTFIYATLYGAGLGKIGSIAGGGTALGKKLKESFARSVPAYPALQDKVSRIAAQGHLPGLDGSRVRVRHAHAALNTLLQSAGAFVMKWALVYACEKLDELGYDYRMVANVHDEFQVEVLDLNGWPEKVAKVLVDSIRRAGEELGCRCPMDGEYRIGTNWSMTH